MPGREVGLVCDLQKVTPFVDAQVEFVLKDKH
jgi:hypothetical protein